MNQDSNSFNNEWPSLSQNSDGGDQMKMKNNLTTNIITSTANNKDFHMLIKPNNTFTPIKNDDEYDDHDVGTTLEQNDFSQMSFSSSSYQPNDLPVEQSSTTLVKDGNKQKNDHDDDDDAGDDDDLDPNNLPETVSILKADDRRIVYLVGTSHFSKPSHRDVRRVIFHFSFKQNTIYLYSAMYVCVCVVKILIFHQ